MKLQNKFLLTIIRDFFLVTYVLFIIFVFLEILKPRLVLNYINLDLYLALLLFLGIIGVLFFKPNKPNKKNKKKLNFLDYSAIFLFSILIGFLILYLTSQLGFLSLFVGLISTVISYYFIITILKS